MVAFAKENAISHDICGKVVVATSDEEEKASFLPHLIGGIKMV